MHRTSVLLLLGSLFATSAAPAGDWFVERAREVGLDFVHFNGMSGRLYYVEVVGAGGALFDYDRDGDLDLYLVQGAILGADRDLDDVLIPWSGERPPRDRLFRNDLEVGADGERRLRFRDVTEESLLRAYGYGMGAAVADIDNDGWDDLYVLNFGRNELWRNRGDGTFEEVAAERGLEEPRWSVSASFADVDADGALDLYVVNYLTYSLIAHRTCLTERGEPDYCLPSAYSPVADSLYRNLGSGRFADVSASSGIAAANANGLGVVAADLDGDRRVDFYVANDLMPNQLWLNRGDWSFGEDGLMTGVALNEEGKAEASMGVAAGDYDGDGDLDLFLTHFRRESDTLYRAQGASFRDVTIETGLSEPSWRYTSFGTGFFDYDNDGWLDLVVANGAVTFVPGADRSRRTFSLDETNQLLRNAGGERFVEVSAEAGAAFELSEVTRGALLGDVDNDGDTDVVFTNNSGPVRLLLNQVGNASDWLGLRLVTGDPLRGALGATVTVIRDGAPSLVRRANSDGGYAGANDPRVLVGLGSGAPVAKEVVVDWPSGRSELWRDLESGRYHQLREGQGQEIGRGPGK